MKKNKEFSKMLDLGKEDIANLTENELKDLNGGLDKSIPLCNQTFDYYCPPSMIVCSKGCPPGTLG